MNFDVANELDKLLNINSPDYRNGSRKGPDRSRPIPIRNSRPDKISGTVFFQKKLNK